MFQNFTQVSRIPAWVYIALILCIGLNTTSKGQDLHYSQFYNQPMIINPALTGIYNGDHRFMFSFRDQARNIPVPYLTFSAAYDRKIYLNRSDKSFFGIGGFFNYDKQGDSQLRLINLNLSLSYSYIINEHNIVSLGGIAGYANRGFDPVALTWDSQWDSQNNVFNQSLPSGETFNMEAFNYVETALGLNYRWQNSERTKLDLGVGAFHLTEPQTSFLNNVNETLPLRLSLYGIFSVELDPKLDLQLDVLHQRQDVYRQFLFGGYLNYYLNNARGKDMQFRVGGGYKTTGEIMFIKAGFQINELFIAASYDMDLSEFGQFDEGSPGKGPEIHVRYIIKNVKPQGRFKVCPIF